MPPLQVIISVPVQTRIPRAPLHRCGRHDAPCVGLRLISGSVAKNLSPRRSFSSLWTRPHDRYRRPGGADAMRTWLLGGGVATCPPPPPAAAALGASVDDTSTAPAPCDSRARRPGVHVDLERIRWRRTIVEGPHPQAAASSSTADQGDAAEGCSCARVRYRTAQPLVQSHEAVAARVVGPAVTRDVLVEGHRHQLAAFTLFAAGRLWALPELW
jgi:hypothetical protein